MEAKMLQDIAAQRDRQSPRICKLSVSNLIFLPYITKSCWSGTHCMVPFLHKLVSIGHRTDKSAKAHPNERAASGHFTLPEPSRRSLPLPISQEANSPFPSSSSGPKSMGRRFRLPSSGSCPALLKPSLYVLYSPSSSCHSLRATCFGFPHVLSFPKSPHERPTQPTDCACR